VLLTACTGTFRKNVMAWSKWNPNNAYGLHDLQKRILFRGIELAAVGANVVYSTCSFNPVENEAVVAAVSTTIPSPPRIGVAVEIT